jgi:hypothetical protein
MTLAHGKRKVSTLMTIQITKPEIETFINHRQQSGGYKDAEDDLTLNSNNLRERINA